MKKFFKAVVGLCLAVLLLSPALMLTGCGNNYTVNISIENEGGVVVDPNIAGNEYKNLRGKNTIKKGEKFSYKIEPEHGYMIEKIEIDGAEVEVSDPYNGVEKYFDDDKNHTVKVWFTARKWTVRIVSSVDDQELFVLQISNREVLDLTQAQYGGAHNSINWYIKNPNNDEVIYLKNGMSDPVAQPAEGSNVTPNKIEINGNLTIYTDLSVSDFNALLPKE